MTRKSSSVLLLVLRSLLMRNPLLRADRPSSTALPPSARHSARQSTATQLLLSRRAPSRSGQAPTRPPSVKAPLQLRKSKRKKKR